MPAAPAVLRVGRGVGAGRSAAAAGQRRATAPAHRAGTGTSRATARAGTSRGRAPWPHADVSQTRRSCVTARARAARASLGSLSAGACHLSTATGRCGTQGAYRDDKQVLKDAHRKPSTPERDCIRGLTLGGGEQALRQSVCGVTGWLVGCPARDTFRQCLTPRPKQRAFKRTSTGRWDLPLGFVSPAR
jgi:hypothetical protein